MLDIAAALAEALDRADYRHDPVLDLLGDEAHAALGRNETVPGLRATRGGSVLETLVRLWILQATVPVSSAEAALPGLVDPLCAAGILERSVGEVAARVDVRPAATDSERNDGTLWIVSDLTPGLDGGPNRVGADHVLGLSPASTSLAQLTVRDRFASALDLGTGCGIQALHLAEHVGRVVATDVNERALWLARLNARLNDRPNVDVREGSFFEPVRGERFDLIATNPPFVISPATGERLVYRDSGLPGDRVVEDIVRTAPRHLTEGGLCQILANWMIVRDQPWEERLGAWVDGCDAWIVQREIIDPAAYVELWLKDSGSHPSTGNADLADYRRRYDTWLSWLEEQGAEDVGFGWINLRRTDTKPDVLAETWPYEVAQPIAGAVAEHFASLSLLRELADDELRARHAVARTDLVQETHGPVGAEDPATVVLRQQTGMRRARQVDTATAALVGACDGELPLAALIDAVGRVTGAKPELGMVRELVAEGFLTLA